MKEKKTFGKRENNKTLKFRSFCVNFMFNELAKVRALIDLLFKVFFIKVYFVIREKNI